MHLFSGDRGVSFLSLEVPLAYSVSQLRKTVAVRTEQKKSHSNDREKGQKYQLPLSSERCNLFVI